MAIGRCGDCKHCEARHTGYSGYAWCTKKSQEVKPDDVKSCCDER